jgi:hypothetical protein
MLREEVSECIGGVEIRKKLEDVKRRVALIERMCRINKRSGDADRIGVGM